MCVSNNNIIDYRWTVFSDNEKLSRVMYKESGHD